ncbi:MAG: gluconokinase [Nitrospiraceae bacterium]
MVIIIMGVSGSGKSTVGSLLASALRWEFVDADAFHSLSNIEKMRRGISLTEEDRDPWLHELQREIVQWLKDDRDVVLACSALKAAHRDLLQCDPQRVRLVYLKGTFGLIEQRLLQRPHHFMPEGLLESQFVALEEPRNAITVDAAEQPDRIVQHIRAALHR